MSSSYDAGYYAEQAHKTRESKCPNSKDGEHDWKRKGSPPSTWGECKKCGMKYFDK